MCSSKEVCFTCLGKNSINDEMIELKKPDLDGIPYITKLKKCVRGLQYGGSKKICMECVERLRIAYNFRETVLLSQKLMQNSAPKENCEGESVDNKKNVEMLIKAEEGKVSCDYNSEDTDLVCNNSSDVLVKLCTELEIEMQNEDQKEMKPKVEDNQHKCAFCDLQLLNKRQLKNHIEQFHKQENLYVCNFCNRGFKKAFHLQEHIASHTGEKKYSCDLCGKMFQRLSSRSRHMKSHDRAPGQKSKRTPFLCTICGKRFPFSNSVQRHMRMHMGIKLHECEICHKRFNQRTHLRVHMRTHTGEKPYVCDLCGNAYSFNATLQKHLLGHKQREGEKSEKKWLVKIE